MAVITPAERERRRKIEDAGDLLHLAFRQTRKRKLQEAVKLIEEAMKVLAEAQAIAEMVEKKLAEEKKPKVDKRQMVVPFS